MIEVNIYLGLAVNGFFTGLGVVMAQFSFEYWKKRVKRLHKKLRKVKR